MKVHQRKKLPLKFPKSLKVSQTTKLNLVPLKRSLTKLRRLKRRHLSNLTR